VLAILLLTFAGIIDHITVNDLSLSFFYIIPLFIVAWRLERKTVIALAIFAAIVKSDVIFSLITAKTLTYYVSLWNFFISLLLYIPLSLVVLNFKNIYYVEKNLARVDYITDIANWNAFSEFLSLEVERSKRNTQPISIAYIDCDNFKELNDEFGHNMGDQILKIIATSLSENIRKVDLVARLGGDEFAVIITNAGENEAYIVVEKLNNILLQKMKEHNSLITFSIGVASYINIPDNVDQMLHNADELMYQVKNNSKNAIKYQVY
jgi:diguanylate cyclase (GGDEF)-like protein